jgi:manganese transport protein
LLLQFFFKTNTEVVELQQAQGLLTPLLGKNASVIFAVALLFSGIASAITSGMAGGIIFAGMHKEPYDIKDNHSRIGVAISYLLAVFIILFISNSFSGINLVANVAEYSVAFYHFFCKYI